MDWCENNVNYILGLARNPRLEALGKLLQIDAVLGWIKTEQKQR